MEFIGIGDIHGDKLDLVIPDATDKIIASLARVFAYALDNGVQNILLYGDVCDKPRMSYQFQVALYRLLLSKRYRDLRFHVILGNHDIAEDGVHSLQVLEVFAKATKRNLTVYSKPMVTEIEGVRFNFLPYPHKETRKDCINVGHFEVSGSLRDNGRKIEEGSNTKHVTVMGHLHTCHKVRKTYYSGTLYQTNFGEHLPKSFHHVKTTGPQDFELQDVPFKPPWQLHNLKVESLDDLSQIKDEPDFYYKAFFKDGLDIDVNEVLLKYPQVIRHNVFKSKEDLKLLINKEWDIDESAVNVVDDSDERQIILDSMKADGLDKSQRKRGIQILKGLTR